MKKSYLKQSSAPPLEGKKPNTMTDLTISVADQTRDGVMEVGTTTIRALGGLMGKYQTALANNRPPSTLFDVELDMRVVFQDHKCPFCIKPLRFARTRPIARCGRKRCLCPGRGGFVIRLAVLTGNLKIT